MGKYNVRVVVVKFFFCWKKTPKGNTGSFFGQNISFFQKQVAKFHPFFWERLSPKSSYWLHFLMVLYKTIANYMQICSGRHSTVATLQNWENKALVGCVFSPQS
jgi:hypothetical protein